MTSSKVLANKLKNEKTKFADLKSDSHKCGKIKQSIGGAYDDNSYLRTRSKRS